MSDYVWKPSREWIAQANVSAFMNRHGYDVEPDAPRRTAEVVRDFLAQSARDPSWFWDACVQDLGVSWSRRYSKVLDRSKGPEWTDWFLDGETNIALNCIDRHASGESASRRALIAETEEGAFRQYTYAELDAEVCRLANALNQLGIRRGDTVASYMPMLAEVVFAMLAAQKLGAIFIPIFSGYAPPAVRERLEHGEVKLVFTTDVSMRRGRAIPLKQELDKAVDGLDCVQHVLVHRRNEDTEPPMRAPRDLWWRDAVAAQAAQAPTVSVGAMEPGLILYTSGTTGRPKGTVHSHAGCLVQMGKELKYNFDLKQRDVFWWVSDIGWMMGPWAIIGVLQHAGTLLISEGAPNYPKPDRVWDSVERHAVCTLGISPTAIRMLMREDPHWVERHPMDSLRLLGSTGEPWDAASYRWYFEQVGSGRCPIINISGGTDIVGCFLAPLPVLPLKAASLQAPGLGMDVDVFDEDGNSVRQEVGYLVCKTPAPSMTRGLWKAPEAYLNAYWSRFPGVWNHGDWALVDADDQWFLFGRADDTMKIAGRRVGPGEIEAALIAHPAVSEAAAVGVPDALKGTDVVCFVVLHAGCREDEALRGALVDTVVEALGKVDRPKDVRFVDELPKTRSAKILRRLIKRRYLGDTDLGDLSSVANPEALDAIVASR